MTQKAFPVVFSDGSVEEGMDLRDYFAAQAMCAIMTAERAHDLKRENFEEQTGSDSIARDAYEIADAMMEERKE